MIDYQKHWGQVKEKWIDAWLPTKKYLENKTCVDIGIWKGVLNAKAKIEFNTDTVIGVEPFEEHREICKKYLPECVLYESIDDLPEKTTTDVILLHGIICLLDVHWKEDLGKIFQKIKANTVHIRNLDAYKPCTGKDRETNLYKITDYANAPDNKTVIAECQKYGYNVVYKQENVIVLQK